MFSTTHLRYLKEEFLTFSFLFAGFQQNNNTQNALLNMTENWKRALDKGTVFMNLSETFDALHRNLLLDKLKAYSFSLNAVKFVQSYLSGRFQRINVNNNFSEWCKILPGVSKEPILGPLSFHIFINNIFYFIQEAYICNFSDNLIYSIEDNFKEVKTILNKNFEHLWFYEKHMLLNHRICHYLMMTKDIPNGSIELDKMTLYAQAKTPCHNNG